jgi:hypothetical protein
MAASTIENHRTRPFLLTQGAREGAQSLPYLSRDLLSMISLKKPMTIHINAGDPAMCPRCLASEPENRLPMAYPIQYTRTSTPTSTLQRTENGREEVIEDIFQSANEGVDNRMAGETYTTLSSPLTTKRSTTNLSRFVDASCSKWIFWYSEDEWEVWDSLLGCGCGCRLALIA